MCLVKLQSRSEVSISKLYLESMSPLKVLTESPDSVNNLAVNCLVGMRYFI